jgi:hypothetical protein
MSPPEFERTHADFRGVNDKRLHEPQLIVDTIDVGLFGQIEPKTNPESAGRRLRSNEELWRDLLCATLGHGDTVILDGFQLLEWLPASPGRYFTPDAVRGRGYAAGFWDWTSGEFLPLGKYEMVLGGVGSVRLAPRFIRGGEVCFFCATSNGISHQGIPVIVPIDEGREILKDIKANGAWAGSLTGTLWPLPVERSPIAFDREIPKYYLFAERLERTGLINSDPLVTVAITYGSTYREGRPELVGGIQINPSKNWSFASFNPSEGTTALKRAVDWLKQYAVRRTSTYEDGEWKEQPPEALAIVGDFDDAHKHFDNPIEFPLASILSGRYDSHVLDFYGRVLNLTVNKEVVMGDKFENIHNATIINRSVVRDAIKSVQASAGADVSEALASVAAAVEESKNAAAGALFNSFTEELNKPVPDKSALKQCWDGLTKLLPDMAAIAAAGAKIATLFS